MHPHDVDEFGILQAPEPLLAATPDTQPTTDSDEHAPQELANRITGNSNTAAMAGSNVDQSTNFDLRQVNALVLGNNAMERFLGEGFEEWGESARVRPRPERGLQDPEALRRLAARYVPPPGLLGDEPHTALRILRERRVLFLTAEANDGGQFSAGLRLGYALQQRESELVVREELIDPGFRLRSEELLHDKEPSVILLDLREAGDQLLEARRRMVKFTAELERNHSYLILIIPYDHVRTFDEDFPGRMHRLGKPPAKDVFARYLTGADAHALIDKTDVSEQIDSLWPPKIREIAEAVSERIKRSESPEEAIHAELTNQSRGWDPWLREEIRQKQEEGNAEWLALLLAAAVLKGAAPQHIVRAGDQMLTRNELEPEHSVPILRPSPHTRLLRLAGEHFDPETREFRVLGLGTQVLRHVWREHPELRRLLVSWLGTIPRNIHDLRREELEVLADGAAELAVEGGSWVALQLAHEWSATGRATNSEGTQSSHRRPGRYRRSIAVRLLTTTATDPFLGRDIRDRLWNWSRSPNMDLQLLTADVCAGIGQSFPRIALTRLKHLASSDNPEVRESVVAAVRQIAGDLGVSRLLRYLPEWFDGAPPARLSLLSAGVSGALADEGKLVDSDSATTFWHRALDTMPPDNLRPIMEAWLRSAAGAKAERRGPMVEAVVQATTSDSRRIAHVQYASRAAHTHTDLHSLDNDALDEVRQQLWTRLDEVDPIWR